MAAAMRQAPLDRRPGGPRQLRRAAHRDLIARMQREELRDVAVPGFGLLVVLRPFLDLAVLANGGRGNLLPRRRDTFAKSGVDAENLARADHCVNRPVMIW